MEALASPAIPPGPERAMGAGGPLVIDTVLMWTANDPVRHHDRLSCGLRDERKHFVRDIYIVANIPVFREPAPEVRDAGILGRNNANRELRCRDIVWAIERDGRDGV